MQEVWVQYLVGELRSHMLHSVTKKRNSSLKKKLYLVPSLQIPYIYYVYKQLIVSESCPTLCDPMDCIACHASLSMGFSRQEYWIGLLFPSPGESSQPRHQT